MEKTSFGAITEYRNGSEVLTRFTHPLEEFNPEISRHTAVQLPFPKNLLNQWEVLWTCTKESYSNEYTSYIFETYQKLTDIETRIKNGEDLFWAELVFLFNPKEELIDLKNNIAGIFSEWKGRTSLFSRTLEVHFQTIQFNQEGHLVIQTEKVCIPFYAGRKSFSKLPIRKITPEEKAQLSERGSLFNRFLDGSYYEYDGNMLVSNGFQPRSFRATGKVIIDCVGLATFKPYIAVS